MITYNLETLLKQRKSFRRINKKLLVATCGEVEFVQAKV